VNEYELVSRKETRVAQLAEKIGPRNLVSFLWLGQAFLNLLPPVRSQGNKFFCARIAAVDRDARWALLFEEGE